MKHLLIFILIVGETLRAQQPQLILPIGHASPISDVCFSPDGKLAVTNGGGEEINVKIWETQTGKLVKTIDAHADKITSVSFSPDSRYLLTTGHDRHAKVWDVQSGGLYYDITYNFSNWIEKGFFTIDGKRILLVSLDAMEYHDLPAKKMIHPLFDTTSVRVYQDGSKWRHSFIRYDLAKNGKFVITTNSDSSIKIWDLGSGKILHKIKDGKTLFQNCAFTFSADKFLASASDNTVKIWQTTSGKLVQSLKIEKGLIIFAAFSPDDRMVITSSFDTSTKKCPVELWDLKTGKVLQTYTTPTGVGTLSVTFSTDGKFLLNRSSDGVVRLWETITGKLLRIVSKMDPLFSEGEDMFTKENLGYIVAAFSEDSKYIIASSYSNTPSIQETITGKSIAKLEGVSTLMYNPQYSPDGNFFATAGLKSDLRTDAKPEGVVSIWGINSGKLILSLSGHKGPVNDLKFSPDGKWLVTASEDSTARVWDAHTGSLIHVLANHEKPVYKCYFSGDNKYLVTQTFSGVARIWDTESGKQLTTVKYDSLTTDKNGIYYIEFSRTGKYLKTVFYDDNSTVFITETSTGKTLLNFNTRKDSSGFFRFDPNEKYLVYSQKKEIVIADIRTGKSLLTIPAKAMINAISLNKDGDILAGAFMDSTTKLWEIPSGKLLVSLRSTVRPIYNLHFSADKKYFVTDNYDSLKVWELHDFHLVNAFKLSFLEHFEFTLTRENRHFIVSRTEENFMNIRDIETGELVTSAFDKFNSSLTYNFNPLRAQFIIDNKFSNEIYNIGSSVPVLKIIPTSSLDYLGVDSAGRYDGTEAARKLLYFTCGTEVVELESVKDLLWVPDLAERIMKGDSINAKTLNDLNICGLTPEVENKNDEVSYYFKITPRRGGLGETVLFVNGIEAARYKQEKLIKNGGSYELKIKKEELSNYLIGGQENQVTIKAYTSDNTISSRGIKINENKTSKITTPPNLYAVMIGVSDYKGDELDLKYAAKDATDISNAIAISAKKLLNTDSKEHVFMYNLTTEKEHYQLPEKNSIKKTLEEIGKKATANDILLIFFAGHGVMSARAGTDGQGENKQFYFLTADASKTSAADAVADVGISTTELTEWMKPQNIKAQKRILIFDACNSGQAIKDFVKMGNSDQNYVAARDDDKARQIKAIDKLNEKSGLFILSASASNQSAYEMGRYSQGLLTYSLLKAIKQQPDILEDGKYLNISRWFNAAERTVSDLAKESGARQEPQIVTNTNFNIGMVDDEVMAKIILPQEKPLFAASNFQNNDEAIADDDLELSKQVNLQLNDIATRGTDSKIVYVTATNSPDAWSLSGRYEVSGNNIVIKVNIKQNKEIKQRFEFAGTKDKLKELATAIADKAAGMVK